MWTACSQQHRFTLIQPDHYFLVYWVGKTTQYKRKKTAVPTHRSLPTTDSWRNIHDKARSRADNREALLLVKFIVQPLQFKHKYKFKNFMNTLKDNQI